MTQARVNKAIDFLKEATDYLKNHPEEFKNNNKDSLSETEYNDIENKIKDFVNLKLSESIKYKPKIGVFGKTGAGKSSLCNAIFGKKISEVSDIKACTRTLNEIPVGNMTLVDAPGIGETIERHIEYRNLYKEFAQQCDLILWVMKADDRAYAEAQDIYENDLKSGCPVFIVLSQVDKIAPHREWNWDTFEPGPNQIKNIEEKINEVKDAFRIDPSHISYVSIDTEASETDINFNLETLLDRIISTIPNKKKASIYRETKKEIRTEKIEKKVEKGFIEYALDTAEEFAYRYFPVLKTPFFKEPIRKMKEYIANGAKSLFKSIFG